VLVDNYFESSFVAKIRITNNTNVVVNSWSVSWNYKSSDRIDRSWNTYISGSNPYTASGISWNSVILPGQSIEFGVQGKSSGVPEVVVVTGTLCDTSQIRLLLLQKNRFIWVIRLFRATSNYNIYSSSDGLIGIIKFRGQNQSRVKYNPYDYCYNRVNIES
jgi:hypothetical protein